LKRDLFERLKARASVPHRLWWKNKSLLWSDLYTALTAVEAVQERAVPPLLLRQPPRCSGCCGCHEGSCRCQREGRRIAPRSRLEVSRLLPDKKPAEFDLVFDVKSDGWFNMMSNLGQMPLAPAVVSVQLQADSATGGQTITAQPMTCSARGV